MVWLQELTSDRWPRRWTDDGAETAETEAIQARWMRGGRGSGSGATMGGEAEAETDWPVTRW
jgi:hypothetical protein